MATQTGNTYISETKTDSIEIPTANLGVYNHAELDKVSASDYDGNRNHKWQD